MKPQHAQENIYLHVYLYSIPLLQSHAGCHSS